MRFLRARYDAKRCDSSLRQGVSPLDADRVDSQKLHTRTFEGSTAPHCKHVFVTGAFCAADACTPARSDPTQNSSSVEMNNKKLNAMLRTRQGRIGSIVHLLGKQVAAERNTPAQHDGDKVSALSSL